MATKIQIYGSRRFAACDERRRLWQVMQRGSDCW